MSDEKVQQIVEEYHQGTLDVGEAAIVLLNEGVPAENILEILGEDVEDE